MVYYVAENGNDMNEGTKNAPFATLEKARDTVRERIAEGLREPITVFLGEGVYYTSPVVFDERDSGTEEFPITYEAQGKVILNGGIVLHVEMFEPLTAREKSRLHGEAAEHVVRVNLHKLGIYRRDYGEMCVTGSHHTGDRYDGAVLSPIWCELFVNDIRQTIARYPNEDFLYTTDPIREGDGLESKITGKVIYRYTLDEWEQKRNPVSDIYGIDPETAKRAAAWEDLRDVWMFGYPTWNWAGMSTPIVRIDEQECAMETKMVARYGMKSHAPYYFYNVFEELDAPGEWYLDRDTGFLYLYPSCLLETAEINLSLLTESILTMNNVSHVTIKGITFAATRADGLTLNGNHLTVENCTVKNVAGNAIMICGNDNHICGCEIYHIGKGGVVIDGGDRATLTPSRNVLENNHIHHISEIFTTYQPAFSLNGVGNLCRHNRIHDSTHMAIYFSGNDHIVEYNEIYDVCKTADDSSAIYAGRDYSTQGTVIRFNYFHDIKSVAKNEIGIYAMYCDDNLGKCTVTQNVFERCQSALLLHGGHNMTFCGNVILEACPKSKYSVVFSKYHYWDDLLEDGLHMKKLREVPWQSEIWTKAYPQIAEYLSWDPKTEQSFPHYADISDNVIINHKPIDINFAWDDPLFKNRMQNNIYLEKSPSENLEYLCDIALPEMIKNFKSIPFRKIGLLKK